MRLEKTVKSSETETNILTLIQFFERKYDKSRSARKLEKVEGFHCSCYPIKQSITKKFSIRKSQNKSFFPRRTENKNPN